MCLIVWLAPEQAPNSSKRNVGHMSSLFGCIGSGMSMVIIFISFAFFTATSGPLAPVPR
jgi:hypothetical protein